MKLFSIDFNVFQEILTDIDELLYVDTDTLFLSPVEQLWSHFKRFNSSQLAGLTQNAETPNLDLYCRYHHVPYVPPTGEFSHRSSSNNPAGLKLGPTSYVSNKCASGEAIFLLRIINYLCFTIIQCWFQMQLHEYIIWKSSYNPLGLEQMHTQVVDAI